jgi:glutamyl/glutaminyl-tRNA synthetase
MLPSVIDDIDMGVTHVVRGEDHVTNTGLQLQMFAALGAPAPAFAHEALLVGSEGKLSKRLGSLGCRYLSARRESSRRRSPPCWRGSGRAIRSSPSPTPRR